MRTVHALILDPRKRSSLQRLRRLAYSVSLHDSAVSLLRAVGNSRGCLVIVEPLLAARSSMLAALRQVLHGTASSALVLYLSLGVVDTRFTSEAARDGAVGCLIAGHDDATASDLHAGLLRASAAAASARIRHVEKTLIPTHLQSCFTYAAANAYRGLDVRSLAAAISVDRRTLYGQLQRACLVDPTHLIGWNRLLHASWLVDDASCTFEWIANVLEFASGSAFTNLARRYVAASPTNLRSTGEAFQTVLNAFVERLARAPELAGPPARTLTG